MADRLWGWFAALPQLQKLIFAAIPALVIGGVISVVVLAGGGNPDEDAVSGKPGATRSDDVPGSATASPKKQAPALDTGEADSSSDELIASGSGQPTNPSSATVRPTQKPNPLQPAVTAPPTARPTAPPTAVPYQVVVESCINGTFTGWSGDTIFELCNGQLWLQAAYAYTYHYAYRPDITIVSYQGSYFLHVDGVDDLVAVSQVTDFFKTCIDGNFDGWDGETVFPLCNGQVWLQAGLGLRLAVAIRPEVLVYWSGYEYRMRVDGADDTIAVTQVTDFFKTCIDGTFEGWDGETVFPLCNGQVWKQSGYSYTYHYAYRPDVLIYWNGYEYRMQVDGVDDTIAIARIS